MKVYGTVFRGSTPLHTSKLQILKIMFNLPAAPTKTKKMGKLIELVPGREARVLENNKPFPILQGLKKEYIQRGHNKNNLIITYIS